MATCDSVANCWTARTRAADNITVRRVVSGGPPKSDADNITVLRVVSDGPPKNGTCYVRVRFESGTDVAVLLFNTVTLVEGSRRDWKKEDWVVCRASARFYHVDSSFQRIGDCKAKKEFSVRDLLRLRQSSLGWYRPLVQDVTQITSGVGVFWDFSAASGFIEVGPQCNKSGLAVLMARVPYAVLVPGDRERAITEARKLLINGY